MSTTFTAVAVESVFTEPGRLALAGFLAGYTGLAREAITKPSGRTRCGTRSSPPRK